MSSSGNSGTQSAPSSSLFAQQPAPQQSTGGLFGSTNQQQQQTPSGGGLFGSTTTQPNQQQGSTTGGLFGASGQQQQQNPQGSSLFGAATTQGTSSGGLFGNTSAQPSTGTGLFGSTNTANAQQQQQQQPAQQNGGLFSSTAQKPTTGLFGSTAQPSSAQGSSLFGQSAQPGQVPQGTGLFGQTSTSTAQQPAGGLFGGGSSSLFGNSQSTQPQPQQSSGLFGSTSLQPSSGAGGLFGSTSQPQQSSLFSSTSHTQPQSSLFPSTAQQPSQSGLFASTTQNPMNASVAGSKHELDIESRMMAVKNAWDSASPECRFKYFFYNKVDPGTTGQYGRPPGANDDAKWAKAMRDNPDPQSMVPVLATGWADVKKRVDMQEKIASVHQEKIKEISIALSQLSRQTSLSTSIRLAALQTQLTTLMHRLIHLVAQTPQFIPILQSTAFRQEEAAVAKVLEGVKADLEGKGKAKGSGALNRRGTGEGRMIGQVNELWGLVEEIRKMRKGVAAGANREGWLADERALAEIAEILSTQQMALQRLSDLTHDSLFDADVMLPSK
ncbi:nucleoporin complex subunit 54-domain-containing protein [Kockovaella imperatae]|uniref:Nucleoporin complex subunit 54-domain-containing protein n=1 Tax=Kockovaella imperatae TaxID=4999 RepID=A0A1Y1U8S5_9TREE|nr:nucleoporin complex subunit 54-domain-containing protein [Kockovaella imperatae]ORX33944.1 nucleoporin complex subunit 54-domain-containing protein [Kockovaella imperatae]